MSSRNNQQAGMAGPQNGPPQQRMQNGGQLYGQQYGQSGHPQQPPMWSSAAPTQPQFGNMGMMQGMQQPMMAGQPTNTYNTTYNQPTTQAQPPLAADTTPKPAMPDPVVTPPKTPAPNANITNPLTAAQNQATPAPNSNITAPLTSMQNQVQNPVAPPPSAYTPPQPKYTPPQPAYTPPPAATTRPSGEQAVNGIVPRPEGTPNYMIDHHANSTTNGGSSITGLLGNMQNEVQGTPDFTDYNLSPRAPVMNQGQQNLVNMGINPMIARLYGSRG